MTVNPEPSPSPQVRLLPDDVEGQEPAPGTVSLRLRTQHTRSSVLDGAWWPRSRDVTSQVTDLIRALTTHLGPLDRVGLDADAWDAVEGRLVVDGQVIHLDWSQVGDDTVLVTCGERDHFALLVVPPEATADAAASAMRQAVEADNTKPAKQILVETGVHTAARDTNDDSP